jgi:aromatic ring hydroxylase
MPMMTADQYEESLRGLNLVVYMVGKKLENVADDPPSDRPCWQWPKPTSWRTGLNTGTS